MGQERVWGYVIEEFFTTRVFLFEPLMSIVVFDSGVGGLSIFRELRIMLPGQQFIYAGDDAGFPYGDWDEDSLTTRIVGIFENLLDLSLIHI